MLAPFFDDKFWFSEDLAGLDAEGDALGIQKVEDGDTVSLSTDCLQEDLCSSSLEDCWTEELSSSDEEDFTWVGLAPTRRPLAFQARGFASEQE
eukprot:3021526-Amphidinium_carterae.1